MLDHRRVALLAFFELARNVIRSRKVLCSMAALHVSNRVFRSVPSNPTNLRKRSFTPLLKHAVLPPVTFHQLRHTAATKLLLKNVNPKVVSSEMLGHASIAITLNISSTARSPLWKRRFRSALVQELV